MTTGSRYLVWTQKREENGCILDFMTGFEKSFRLSQGVRLSDTYPEGVEFPMSPDYPRNLLMTDNLYNKNGVIVACDRLAQFLKGSDPERIELLPVTVVNHKGKKLADKCFIVNTIDNVDCFDAEKSGSSWYTIGNEVREVEQLIIDETKIGDDRTLFRCQVYTRITLIRREFAEAIDREGFTGVRWVELNDYPEI